MEVGTRRSAGTLLVERRDFLRYVLVAPQKLVLFNRHGHACITAFCLFPLVALDAPEATHPQLAREGDFVRKRQNDLC